jgi:predicted nucleic acid-binding protein
MNYLFDSSSIYTLIKSDKPEFLVQNYTCSLARYETGNVLLTEMNARKTLGKSEQRSLLNIICRALNVMHILGIKGSEQQIIDLASKYGLSFYDASYAYLAKRMGSILVTEDVKLANKVGKYVSTAKAADFM